MLHKNFILKYLALFLLLTASFAFGNFLSFAIHYYSAQETISNAVGNWGLSFQEEGKRPVGNASIEELQQYDAYYAQDTDEKNIYLTFDCGYENGNTEIILDALKKQKKTGIWFLLIQDVLLAELPSRFLIWNLMVMSADVERIFILMERKSIPL